MSRSSPDLEAARKSLAALSPEEKKILRDAFIEAFGTTGSEKRDTVCRAMANEIGKALGQEYKMHEGHWWLWTLGKPARALTDEEIKYHKLG